MFLGVGNNFPTTYAIVLTFLQNLPMKLSIRFVEVEHSHSTIKGASACAELSKLYNHELRNMAQSRPKVIALVCDFVNYFLVRSASLLFGGTQ